MKPLLSILDTVPIGPGDGLSTALRRTTELAHAAEALGYHRLWFAEHHAHADSGCGVPAVMLAHIASVVHGIHLGAGGVMLPNHAPLVVAEQFRTLEALFPGRIDLGIGRAMAIQPDLAPALRRACDDYAAFGEQISELRGFLVGRFDTDHRFRHTELPALATVPPVFLLGASAASASLAGTLGLRFAYAHYQNPTQTADAIALYRDRFTGSDGDAHAIVSVRVLGRDTAARASSAASWKAAVDIRQTAARDAGLTFDDRVLLEPSLTDIERRLSDSLLAKSSTLIGDAAQLRSDLLALAVETGADELMIVPTEFDTPGRLATMRTVAEGWQAN